jgi:hypothetical protein
LLILVDIGSAEVLVGDGIGTDVDHECLQKAGWSEFENCWLAKLWLRKLKDFPVVVRAECESRAA